MLISDKQFIALTEIAKKIAYSITGENLSTDHYLCALRVASKNISFNEILGEISSWEVVSDAAAKRLNFDINKSLVDGSAPQLKLSDSFREILSSLKNNSFKEFITALVSKESDGRPSIVKDAAVVLSAENDAHFDAIYGFADVLAQAHNLSTIDLDTFVIGAWAATKAGVLKDRPSIVNNLHANADAIQYLMKCRGWKLPKDKSPNLSRTISQGGDLVEALASASKSIEGWLFDLAQQRIQILMKRAYARTEEIVSGHWSEIEIVAGALMKNKKLSADDLLRLIPKLIR